MPNMDSILSRLASLLDHVSQNPILFNIMTIVLSTLSLPWGFPNKA
jgi:hypothetical protein